MRLLCFADVHLGAGAEYGTSAYGPGSRLADQESILGQLAERVVREKADAVLFAGDAFHRRKPTPAENEMWRRFLQHVSRLVPVVMIPGNHDVSQAGVPNALTPFGLGIPGVALMSEPGIVKLPQHGEPEAYVICVPWWPMSHFAHLHPDVDVDDLHAAAADQLHAFIDSIVMRIATSGDTGGKAVPVIVLTHYSVSGATTPTGADVSGFRELVLDERALEYCGADAVVLGHIHGYQELMAERNEPNIPVFYCGSPNIVDFGEADISHGYVMLDIVSDPPATSIEFQSLIDRRFVTLEADWRDKTSNWTTIPAVVKDAVVRVRVKLRAGQTIDQSQLRRQLMDAGAHKVYAVQVDIERADRPSAEVDEDTDSGKAFGTYLERQEISDELREGAGARHAHYMEEES